MSGAICGCLLAESGRQLNCSNAPDLLAVKLEAPLNLLCEQSCSTEVTRSAKLKKRNCKVTVPSQRALVVSLNQ